MSGGVIAAIVGGVALLAIGAVVFLLLRPDQETAVPPPPPPPVPTTPASPTPTAAPSPSPSPTETETDDPTPPVDPGTESVTLTDLVPSRVAAFRLVSVDPDPQAISELGAVDALVAQYSRADNVRITMLLQGYADRFDADRIRDFFVAFFRDNGYTVVGEAGAGGVRATRLQGPDEAVVWSVGPLVAILEGPFDITTGFFAVLPYGGGG